MGIKEGTSTLSSRFMGSCATYDEASVVLVGVPMDFTCIFRPGTRFGPQRIREVSIGVEEYSPYIERDLSDYAYYDAGDLELPFGNVEKSLEVIGDAAKEIFDDNKFPLFIGGEHLSSVPIIKRAYEKYGDDLVLLHFDAHADLRTDYMGCENSHASAIRRVIDFMPSNNIFQYGIRSGTKDEFVFARENTHTHMFEVLQPLKGDLPKIGNRPVYVTLDIDVVDPAYAGGTGTPEPGGISSAELIKAVLLMKNLKLIGFDLVEVSPPFDSADCTSLLAAKIIREIILSDSYR